MFNIMKRFGLRQYLIASCIVAKTTGTSGRRGLSEFPFRRTVGKGVDTLVDHVREDDKPQVYALLTSVASKGEGLSKDQFQTQDQLDDFLGLGTNFCCKDMDMNGKLYAFLNVYPTPLSRSNRPLLHAGYAIVEPEYRARGVMSEMLIHWGFVGFSHGYHGTLARTSMLTHGGYIGSKRAGAHFIGVIPDSISTDQDTWVDDLVIHRNYADSVYEQMGLKKMDPHITSSLPAINPKAAHHAHRLCQPSVPLESGNFCKITQLFVGDRSLLTGNSLFLELAGQAALEVEEMIQAAAQRGEGFGLDEFDEDGLLNRKFLRQSVTLVARRISGSALIGGAVIGPSAIGRAMQSSNMAGYIVVSDDFRRQGYGSEILELCERIASRLGYRNMTPDVLYSARTPAAFQLAVSKGYLVTAHLPNCAFLKDTGMTNSFVLFKSIGHS